MAVSAKGFRLLIATLTVTLLGVLSVTLWRFGSTPTDENLFVQPPSAVMLTAAVPGDPPSDGTSGAGPLQPGDILIAIEGTRLFSVSDYRKAIDRASRDVRVTVIRRQPNKEIEVTAAAD